MSFNREIEGSDWVPLGTKGTEKVSLGLVGNREGIQDRDQKQIPPCHYFGLFTDFFLFSFEIVPTEKIGPLPSTFLNSQVFTQEINKQKKQI